MPEVRNSKLEVRNSIDNFVLARLQAEGLTTSPQAPKETLLRRVTLDLTGLPPSLSELRDFLSDDAPDAYEKVVDRLLASPRHAERMAMRRVPFDVALARLGHRCVRQRDVV
ncbi:MAG: hypothetical protein FD138_4219 [Planctomycetota bacterium]|nr:MAG: hypothetical protein FD138_4219 [Planctomycetota bacterium]